MEAPARASREDQNFIEENLRTLRELLTLEKYQWEALGETDGVRLSRLKVGAALPRASVRPLTR